MTFYFTSGQAKSHQQVASSLVYNILEAQSRILYHMSATRHGWKSLQYTIPGNLLKATLKKQNLMYRYLFFVSARIRVNRPIKILSIKDTSFIFAVLFPAFLCFSKWWRIHSLHLFIFKSSDWVEICFRVIPMFQEVWSFRKDSGGVEVHKESRSVPDMTKQPWPHEPRRGMDHWTKPQTIWPNSKSTHNSCSMKFFVENCQTKS